MQIDADLNFQRRIWTAQRIGWFVVAIVMMAALLGLFGGGPISRASAQGDGVDISYERFARLQQATRVHISLGPEARSQLALSRRYLDAVHVEQITPEPREIAAAGGWLVYHFTGAGPISITFTVTPEHSGGLSGAVQITGGRAVVFEQFVYP